MQRAKYSWNPIFTKMMEIKDYYMGKGDSVTSILESLKRGQCKAFEQFLYPLKINIDLHSSLLIVGYDGIKAAHASDMWTNQDSIYREARYIVIDLDKDELVICPPRKFFNINEVTENSVDNIMKEIENARIYEVTDKLDCSMQNASVHNGKCLLVGTTALKQEDSLNCRTATGS